LHRIKDVTRAKGPSRPGTSARAIHTDMVERTEIGLGGTERWIASPVLLWLVMFGTVLMMQPSDE